MKTNYPILRCGNSPVFKVFCLYKTTETLQRFCRARCSGCSPCFVPQFHPFLLLGHRKGSADADTHDADTQRRRYRALRDQGSFQFALARTKANSRGTTARWSGLHLSSAPVSLNSLINHHGDGVHLLRRLSCSHEQLQGGRIHDVSQS